MGGGSLSVKSVNVWTIVLIRTKTNTCLKSCISYCISARQMDLRT